MADDAQAGRAPSATGTVTVPSPFPVDATADRLAAAIRQRGLILFAEVDHSGGAHEVGLAMNDARLLIFGHPRGGTPAMVAAPLLGLELPLRALVWADDDGRCWVSYQDPADLARRFQLTDELVAPLSGVARLVSAALS
ncbi:DUF302 domain-containing protein [Kitasatospora sp. NPDC052896]|uniref:DUF302 domain-containing protein n=1 Tax=Kitasatospora sp. NPDC052896 TaxID=3364061 RepID=UPI0037C8F6B4